MYLEPDELELAGIPQALGHATNQQLLDEIQQRVDPEAARLFRGEGDAVIITPKFASADDAIEEECWAARRIDEMSQSDYINRASARRCEEPDPEGPENGA
ncbi:MULTISPECIES: hypothetical protein [Gordonia]|uniref:hypothetical protein n=1 Tax=Gordonia TaxID=2053 RepID=UPI00034B5B97|nr:MULTISPECIES: hypothetical protein [Gordonia]